MYEPKHSMYFRQTFLFSFNGFTQKLLKKESSDLWVTKHIIKASRNTVRCHHKIRQGVGVGWESTQRREWKCQAPSSEDTALLTTYFASWSLVINTVMLQMHCDLGSLTSLHTQAVATATWLCAGLYINVLASSIFLYGLFQTLTVKYIFTCISMDYRF